MNRLLALAFAALIAMPGTTAPAFARAMETGDASIARQATPAVVNISTWKLRPADKAGDPPRRVKTYGSGFIVDPTGIIVTNKHVIDGSISVKVLLSDGNSVVANVMAAAAMLDLAVLKIDVGHPLPILKWGDSDALQVGDPVLTVGNPLGIGMSVSAGIVSALNRDLQDTPFDSYIQTDASINHGNSGGPLVDHDGKVIGVNTALYNPDENGGFIGIGFAIPAESARFVLGHLLDPKHPKPGWIGITLQDVTPELSEALSLPANHGSIISVVDRGGPADRAGLRPGDVLAGIDARQPADSRAFMRAVVVVPPGQQVRLRLWRDGEEQTATATVAEWPNAMPDGGTMSASLAESMIQKMPDPGVRLAPITEDARKKYGLDPKLTGALVASVEPDCEARDIGILPGDVITAVQGDPVTSPDDVRRAIRMAHDKHRPYLALLIQGRAAARWVSLSIGNPGS